MKPISEIVILEFMRKHGLQLGDLYEVGWESRFKDDPTSPDAVKCKAVERCWELIARAELKFADLKSLLLIQRT
jgi:hypothetical protein